MNFDGTVESAGKIFNEATKASVGVVLSPLDQSFKAAYEWLLGKVSEQAERIQELETKVREFGNKTPYEADFMGEDERNDPAVIQTFARIARITGVEIPKDQWSRSTHEICYDMLEKLYVRDPLTDLLSTYSFNERLGEIIRKRKEAKQSSNEASPCTVVVCDLNNFKSYNTNIQYERTDKVLKNQ